MANNLAAPRANFNPRDFRRPRYGASETVAYAATAAAQAGCNGGTKRKSGRRANGPGRSGGDGHHVRLYDWEINSDAYRSLSLGARCFLVELKALYAGNNNGRLFMSVREAAHRLNRPNGKNLAGRLFEELQEKGFIRANAVGAFSVKSDAIGGRATSRILTEFALAGALPTKDFMRWRPGDERKFAVPPAVRTVPATESNVP